MGHLIDLHFPLIKNEIKWLINGVFSGLWCIQPLSFKFQVDVYSKDNDPTNQPT